MNIRIVPASLAELLPLQLETIGINVDQEPIERPNGYPYFHWLQTLKGEGELSVNSQTWKLTERSGILLAPDMPHRYEAKGDLWQTGYITFHGSLADKLIHAFGWNTTERFQWEAENDRVSHIFVDIMRVNEYGGDPSGWQSSSGLYQFLTSLRTDARTERKPSMSKQLQRIQLLLDWIEREFANPEIGLTQMARQLNISERQLNEKFRKLFGQTAYQYLIQLRIRKAKEYLPSKPEWTIGKIGEAVGFRDASHFVATFRQKVGMTPETYRKLYGTSSE